MEQDINQLIADHYGFIIKTVSETSNRYVRIGDDDSFSIGLLAFQEAYEKYDDTKGPFLAFAKLVIRSRVIDYLRKENRQPNHDSLEDIQEAGGQFVKSTILCKL
ncbi:hypothetical protein AWM75_04675 [Aerococcus urinaehominis]|uniref:Uncharacterized protein n=1 Tax=Aerococcus urinaehominis TaxID=128944 RepID=A0A0X8FMF7_9LACT|nr:sigma factor [Aerococcus urinaehominis]AMB99337.1 hypothetical protein AWM75_04675 [Aerococcus urinaehominis]SDM58761.1 RNA polymerase sigma-I factor [Aerococcus urinaehominis]